MRIHLFVKQICEGRNLCKPCRDTKTDLYRKRWSGIYTLPPGWPECPFGMPWDTLGFLPALPTHLMGVVADDPDSEESKEITRQAEARASTVRPICLACPSGNFRGLDDTGMLVDCAVAYPGQCLGCGDRKPMRGIIHLGTSECRKSHWKGKVEGVTL